MKKLIIVLAAICATQAQAADMATKARPSVLSAPVCTTTTCSGWFAGVGLGGNGTNLDILGSGLDNSVFANGIIPFGTLGAQLWNGSTFIGFEASVGYQIANTANVGTASSNQSGVIGWQFAEVGGNLGSLFGSQTPVTIQSALVQDLISPYVLVGPVEISGAIGTAEGAGVRYLLPGFSRPFLIDVKYFYANMQETTNGAVAKNMQAVMTGLNVPFNW